MAQVVVCVMVCFVLAIPWAAKHKFKSEFRQFLFWSVAGVSAFYLVLYLGGFALELASKLLRWSPEDRVF